MSKWNNWMSETSNQRRHGRYLLLLWRSNFREGRVIPHEIWECGIFFWSKIGKEMQYLSRNVSESSKEYDQSLFIAIYSFIHQLTIFSPNQTIWHEIKGKFLIFLHENCKRWRGVLWKSFCIMIRRRIWYDRGGILTVLQKLNL